MKQLDETRRLIEEKMPAHSCLEIRQVINHGEGSYEIIVATLPIDEAGSVSLSLAALWYGEPAQLYLVNGDDELKPLTDLAEFLLESAVCALKSYSASSNQPT